MLLHLFVTLASCCFNRPANAPPHAAPQAAKIVAEYDAQPLDLEFYEEVWMRGYESASPLERRLPDFNETKAAEFLDATSRNWAEKNACGTCHTNIPFLMARPLMSRSHDGDETVAFVRAKILEYFRAHAAEPLAAFFVPPSAVALAINDDLSSRRMSDATRELFDAAWALQDADGSWHYPLDNMVPFLERQQRYVAYFVSVGVGFLPAEYRASATVSAGVAMLSKFIRMNPPEDAHDKAVLLWASAQNPAAIPGSAIVAYRRDLLRLQGGDGGWNLHRLGRWPRHDGPPNDPEAGSDAYATALAALALCSSGSTAADPQIVAALEFLDQGQRVSGRWYMRSTYSEQFKGYVSNMATAYAVLALKTCRNGPRQRSATGW